LRLRRRPWAQSACGSTPPAHGLGRDGLAAGQAQRILATSEVVFAKIENTLNRALALVGRCDEVYRLGGPEVRRLSNQFFFEKLLIDVEEEATSVVGAELREPWATVLNPASRPRMAASTKNPGHLFDDRGSKEMSLVPPAVVPPAGCTRQDSNLRRTV
jgi:hypothetical protein